MKKGVHVIFRERRDDAQNKNDCAPNLTNRAQEIINRDFK